MECLETFVADCNKRFFNIEETNKAVRKVETQLESTQQQIDKVNNLLNSPKKTNPLGVIDNAEFIKLMNISDKTSQNWRHNKLIKYSLIGGRVYYRISDIIQMIESNCK